MKSNVTRKVWVNLLGIGAMLGFVAQLNATPLPGGVYVASNPSSGPAQILLDRIFDRAKSDEPRRIHITPELIVRGSTASAPSTK